MRTQELFDLKGKVALVTGGSRGLGRQMALGLAEAGANVAVCSRTLEDCERVAEELRQLDVKALALRCDVRSEEEVQVAVKRVEDTFGKIDILVNNAGVSWGITFENMTVEQWTKVMDTNAMGVFLMCREVGKSMLQTGGKIINIASIAGLYGSDPLVMNATGYHASKGAVVALTRDLAIKWARKGIYVNAIAPGVFPTKMSRWMVEQHKDRILESTPLGKFGGEDDLKGAVVFLASRASDFITGQILCIDGGASAQ